jgi:hypothetical protein
MYSLRILPNQERTLLRELRISSLFCHTSPGLRFDSPAELPRQPLRRISRLQRKRTRRQHFTRLLRMRSRLRRPSRVRLPTPQEPIRHDTENLNDLAKNLAPLPAQSHLSRLPSRHCHPHRGHIRR